MTQLKGALMEFHFENHSPVYLQLAAILEDAIMTGQYEPGQKLPSVRELALEAKVNPNTVAKAMQELESKGFIETRRTAGKYVTLNAESQQAIRKKKGLALCTQFLKEMEKLGYHKDQAITLLKEGDNHASGNT